MLSLQRIASVALTVVCLMVAAVLHEMAHAGVALACGDTTARDAGRLTLNPLAHIDPVGSLALPFLMALVGGPVFAYARPVPYNPARLRHPVRDEVLVALAGPAANLAQAAVAGIAVRLLFLGPDAPAAALPVAWASGLLDVLLTYLWVNLSLMLFNLIPLPPLDGSAIVSPLLTGRARETYYRVQAYAMPILIVALYLLPAVVGWDPVGDYLYHAGNALYRLLLGI